MTKIFPTIYLFEGFDNFLNEINKLSEENKLNVNNSNFKKILNFAKYDKIIDLKAFRSYFFSTYLIISICLSVILSLFFLSKSMDGFVDFIFCISLLIIAFSFLYYIIGLLINKFIIKKYCLSSFSNKRNLLKQIEKAEKIRINLLNNNSSDNEYINICLKIIDYYLKVYKK